MPFLAVFMMSFNTKSIYVAIPLEDTYGTENQLKTLKSSLQKIQAMMS